MGGCHLFMMVCGNTPLCNKQTACSCVHQSDSSSDSSGISNINRQPLCGMNQISTRTNPISQFTLSTTQTLNSPYRKLACTTYKMCIRTTHITHCIQCTTQFEERISTTLCDKAEGELGKCGKVDDIVSDREILCARCRYENSKKSKK